MLPGAVDLGEVLIDAARLCSTSARTVAWFCVHSMGTR